ncbi:MAG: phospholipid carrier-dependent glycosyltransferase [Verrucomicrobiota bacterium]|nr:phospholipid carrier-dependent glycosyltransferase [Verrucomicrobiota bacterium]
MPPNDRRILAFALCAVLAIGIFLRLPPNLFEKPGALHALAMLHPNPGFMGTGVEESLYRGYVNAVIRGGLTSYPDIVDRYIEVQKTLTGSILPPMRFLYIFSAYVWHQLFGTEALLALHYVASFFGILSLLLAAVFAWRLKGPECALGVSALVAFAPTQIHMSQHALVDGFFAFWALFTLWMFWENLRAPRDWRWLVPYTLALCLIVLTKENAAFVYFALLVLLLLNRWLQWGKITRELLACTLIGPLLGFVILVFLAGGLATLREAYQLSVSKNYHLVYAIVTGDGPWNRYIVDLLLVSPIVVLLAIGSLFRLDRTKKPELFLTVFIGASYLVMCNLKYGMNLRYANMWDMPLRVLAFSGLTSLVAPFVRYRTLLLCAAVALICAVEMRQYILLFVDYPLYELVSEGLLRALQILKSAPPNP